MVPRPAAHLFLPVSQVRIGRPGYRVTKQFDGETGARGLLFQVGAGFCREGMLRS